MQLTRDPLQQPLVRHDVKAPVLVLRGGLLHVVRDVPGEHDDVAQRGQLLGARRLQDSGQRGPGAERYCRLRRRPRSDQLSWEKQEEYDLETRFLGRDPYVLQ